MIADIYIIITIIIVIVIIVIIRLLHRIARQKTAWSFHDKAELFVYEAFLDSLKINLPTFSNPDNSVFVSWWHGLHLACTELSFWHQTEDKRAWNERLLHSPAQCNVVKLKCSSVTRRSCLKEQLRCNSASLQVFMFPHFAFAAAAALAFHSINQPLQWIEFQNKLFNLLADYMIIATDQMWKSNWFTGQYILYTILSLYLNV